MIEWLREQIEYFLSQFWEKPGVSLEDGFYSFSLEKVIRHECTHFLFSCFSGWLVFSLTLTIFSSERFKEYAPYMWNISLVSGLLASATMHMLIDAYTKIA